MVADGTRGGNGNGGDLGAGGVLLQLPHTGDADQTQLLLESFPQRHTEEREWEEQRAWIAKSDTHGGSIFCRTWAPKSGSVAGLLFVVHGVNEHISRYGEFAHHMTKLGWLVHGHDHWGHGASGGFRGDIEDFNWLVADMKQLIRAQRAIRPTVPIFVLGHSMGSIAAFLATHELEEESPGLVNGVVFSGFAMVPGPSAASPFGLTCLFCLTKSDTASRLIGGFMAKNQPRGPLAPLIMSQLTHMKEELAFIDTDPHHVRGPLLNRTGNQIYKASQRVKSLLGCYKLPFFAVHGDSDTVTLPTGSQTLFSRAASHDKALKFYPGLYHELLFESQNDRARVTADIVAFLGERAKAAANAAPAV